MTKKVQQHDYKNNIETGYNVVKGLHDYSAAAMKNNHMAATVLDSLAALNKQLSELDNVLKAAFGGA
jgi:hypothetical protein